MPLCTRASRSAKSMSRIFVILAVPRMIASPCAMAPPAREVPAPRGTTRTPLAWQ